MKSKASTKKTPEPVLDPHAKIECGFTVAELALIEQVIKASVVYDVAKPISDKIENAAQAYLKSIPQKSRIIKPGTIFSS